jgi:uncharacterized membrane protein YraQ (UPF0718 family)
MNNMEGVFRKRLCILKKLEAVVLSLYLSNLSWSDLLNFKMIFFSIIIEALPFILIGTIVSSLLNHLVSEELIKRLLPNNKYISIFIASTLGILFPLCECGIVPITRRLVQKGVPVYIAVTFMLATPIINPVVASATFIAFSANPQMVWERLSIAFLVSVITGILLSFMLSGSQLRDTPDFSHQAGCCCGVHQHKNATYIQQLFLILNDICTEFFEMGKFLILGAILSTLAQTMIPYSLFSLIGQSSFLSIAAMMIFAFFISVCSSADAFIAASLGTSFTPGSLLAFMVFGPMIDFKNTFMLYHSFQTRFVIVLIAITSILCGSFAYLINRTQGGM